MRTVAKPAMKVMSQSSARMPERAMEAAMPHLCRPTKRKAGPNQSLARVW
jgi:hypothetical protein